MREYDADFRKGKYPTASLNQLRMLYNSNTNKRNENLLMNVTKRMEMQLDKYTQREDLDEHLQVLTAIMTDLTVDVGKTLDYLAYSKEGLIPTCLLPLEQIITDLRESASLYLIIKIIFTTLKFPIIAYPTYKVIRATP
ncbi:hypothetical protein ALC60_13086 [Trachymyrmex zeteki]|uniref:Uncharacterized protein n=1 Tax=Mycetomoellerius zeteki TaxID=64791 RepID=A0A151WJ88_9HYME|nr:hypothetical protein ALC60_13086 [Trachymyrmex zeteki]